MQTSRSTRGRGLLGEIAVLRPVGCQLRRIDADDELSCGFRKSDHAA